MNIKHLRKYKIKSAREGYASGNEGNWKKEPDGSTTITHESFPWRTHDNFFGGEPFGGREVIFSEDKAVWIMVYYGAIDPRSQNIKELYGFLQKALSRVPDEAPYRGPMLFEEGKFRYTNAWEGTLERFSGIEMIYENDQKVYETKYVGGLVDQREET